MNLFIVFLAAIGLMFLLLVVFCFGAVWEVTQIVNAAKEDMPYKLTGYGIYRITLHEIEQDKP